MTGEAGMAGEAGTTGRAGTIGEAREDTGVVPHPRTGAEAGAPAVPHPRQAADPDTATVPPRDADTGAPLRDVDTGGNTDTQAPPWVTNAPAVPRPDGGLTERERGILAFEQQWWRHAGAKEQAIRDTFGLSATRYYQLLNTLLDNPAALAAEPVLIGRLRRLRSSRARNRRR
ncbi:DUF3263 domain-containing protein [Micromonospora peucetia]|uniref:DUF3263 domain-containing protein n=1 Tax=Micromonospora peucetia TaxID=47871 RepID=UPI003EBEA390